MGGWVGYIVGRWAWLSGLRGRGVVVLSVAAVVGAGLAGSRATGGGLGVKL